MRLHKLLADLGYGSRRKMEEWIQQGLVKVDGETAHIGQVVTGQEKISINGNKPINLKAYEHQQRQLPEVCIYHKPAGEIVTRIDPENRRTVFRALKRPENGKWIAIGRLDLQTEGLLIFTNSGELANLMMHPRYEVPRVYAVRILGRLNEAQMQQLIDGIELEDGIANVLNIREISDPEGNTANNWYEITLMEGRNREVRRIFEFFGITVSRLIRTRFGTLNMPGHLKRGKTLNLTEKQVRFLMKSVGMN
jgi:23S rRNA pseudouridine2605 synthase